MPRSIPPEILEDIRRSVINYAVSLFRAPDAFKPQREEYIGSGTLVAIGDRPFVLTAVHVWKAIAEQKLMMVLLDDEGRSFRTPVDAVRPHIPALPGEDPQWGPDIAFLEMPNEIRAQARDRRIFYRLDTRWQARLGKPVDWERGVWAIGGAPDVLTRHGTPISTLCFHVFISGVVAHRQVGDFDYLDFSIDEKERQDLPRTYGGVSGAGLWQASLARSQSTGRITWPSGRLSLEGVAFYERLARGAEGCIRCHGRRSIYEHAKKIAHE